jgi:UDP-sulfoquinovose synthase
MVAAEYNGVVTIDHSPTPRVEKEEHYYRAAHTKLLDLGLNPHLLTRKVIQSILTVADQHKANVDPAAILATVDWTRTASTLATAGGGVPQGETAVLSSSTPLPG